MCQFARISSIAFRCCLLALLSISIRPTLTLATTYQHSGGDWSEEANWTPLGGPPIHSDTAEILATGSITTVMDISPTVQNLTMNSSSSNIHFPVDGRVLTVSEVMELTEGTVTSAPKVTPEFLSKGGQVLLDSRFNGDFRTSFEGRTEIVISDNTNHSNREIIAGAGGVATDLTIAGPGPFTNSGLIQSLSSPDVILVKDPRLPPDHVGTLHNTIDGVIEVPPFGVAPFKNFEFELINDGAAIFEARSVLEGINADHMNKGTLISGPGGLTINGNSFTQLDGRLKWDGSSQSIFLNTDFTQTGGILEWTPGNKHFVVARDKALSLLGGTLKRHPVVDVSGSPVTLDTAVNGGLSIHFSGENTLILPDGETESNWELVLGQHAASTVTADSDFINKGTIRSVSSPDKFSVPGTVQNEGLIEVTHPGRAPFKNLEFELDNRPFASVRIASNNVKLGMDTDDGGENGVNRGLIKTGCPTATPGSLTIYGDTFTNERGGTMSGSGTYNVSNVTFTNNGTISPGCSTGTLTFVGNVVHQWDLAVQMDNFGVVSTAEVIGNLTVGEDAFIRVLPLGDFLPNAGDEFTIIRTTNGTIDGKFAGVVGPLPEGAWELVEASDEVKLRKIDSPAANFEPGLQKLWSIEANWNVDVPRGADDPFPPESARLRSGNHGIIDRDFIAQAATLTGGITDLPGNTLRIAELEIGAGATFNATNGANVIAGNIISRGTFSSENSSITADSITIASGSGFRVDRDPDTNSLTDVLVRAFQVEPGGTAHLKNATSRAESIDVLGQLVIEGGEHYGGDGRTTIHDTGVLRLNGAQFDGGDVVSNGQIILEREASLKSNNLTLNEKNSLTVTAKGDTFSTPIQVQEHLAMDGVLLVDNPNPFSDFITLAEFGTASGEFDLFATTKPLTLPARLEVTDNQLVLRQVNEVLEQVINQSGAVAPSPDWFQTAIHLGPKPEADNLTVTVPPRSFPNVFSMTIQGINPTATVSGQAGAIASATNSVTVKDKGILTSESSDEWTLYTPILDIESGGELSGNINIVGNVNVHGGGRVSPGLSPGKVSVTGTYSQQESSELFIELGGTVAESEYDVLSVEGLATLDGDLTVQLIDLEGNGLFAPSIGDSFEIATASDGFGGTQFASTNLPQLPDGIFWDLSYLANSVLLQVTDIVPLLGDYNQNGSLDAGDLDLQAQAIKDQDLNFDLTGDGLVNFADRAHWVGELKNTWIGDADLNGEFSSSDLVKIFGAGKYEVDVDATWEEGDWDGDLRFGTADLIAAFQDGGYEIGQKVGTAAVPEPTLMVLLVGFALIFVRFRTGITVCIGD